MCLCLTSNGMNVNKVLLVGNLTRDPEMRSLPSGQPVVNFGIATNRVWKDKDGQKQQQAEFHNVVAFGKTAELVHQYMKKGSSMFVEGRLQTRTWDAQDGSKKSRTEVVAENIQFGPRGQGGGTYAQTAQSSSPSPRSPQPVQQQEDIATVEYPEDDVNPEEIPF